jgi:hypothetical protein
MLNLEDALHAVLGSFFDGERLGLQGLEGARGRKIERDVRPTFYFLVENQIWDASSITRARTRARV